MQTTYLLRAHFNIIFIVKLRNSYTLVTEITILTLFLLTCPVIRTVPCVMKRVHMRSDVSVWFAVYKVILNEGFSSLLSLLSVAATDLSFPGDIKSGNILYFTQCEDLKEYKSFLSGVEVDFRSYMIYWMSFPSFSNLSLTQILHHLLVFPAAWSYWTCFIVSTGLHKLCREWLEMEISWTMIDWYICNR
jgi:hypothetical protein